MFTVLVTILAIVMIAAVLLKIVDSIVVDTWTISTRDCPNIVAQDAGSAPFCGPAEPVGSHHTGVRS